MAPCRRSYILLVQKLRTSEMLDKWSLTSKLSDIKFSHIPDGRFFYIWYLQIFSRVFPWLNFEYWIICQLSSFKCKSATVYILHNFSNVLADLYFSRLYLSFHWLSFCELFSGVFFSLAWERQPGKKPAKNVPPNSL